MGDGNGVGDGTVPALPANGTEDKTLPALPAPSGDDRTVSALPAPGTDDKTVPAIPIVRPQAREPAPAAPAIAYPAPATPATARATPASDPAPLDQAPLDQDPDPRDPNLLSGEPPSSGRLAVTLAYGPTLADLSDDEPMCVHQVVRIGSGAAMLLAHIHEQGRAHGAVTAANVLLGPGGRVQLAHIQGATNSEVGADAGNIRPADDVHDLGVALTRALIADDTGTIPPDVPRTLRRVLESATEVDPAQRPTARQMVDMLSWLDRSEPAEGPRRWWATSGTAAWAFGGAALLVVLVALTGVALLSSDRAQAPGTSTASSSAAPASAESSSAAASESTTVAPTPSASEVPPVLPTALPTALPSALPTALPSALPALPSFDLPTTLPALPTELPEVPAEAQGLWDRFVDWLRGLV